MIIAVTLSRSRIKRPVGKNHRIDKSLNKFRRHFSKLSKQFFMVYTKYNIIHEKLKTVCQTPSQIRMHLFLHFFKRHYLGNQILRCETIWKLDNLLILIELISLFSNKNPRIRVTFPLSNLISSLLANEL